MKLSRQVERPTYAWFTLDIDVRNNFLWCFLTKNLKIIDFIMTAIPCVVVVKIFKLTDF